MTDAEILACYERGDERTPTEYLYEKSPWIKNVRKKVKYYGGSREDYEEILGETIVRFNGALLDDAYKYRSGLEAFFMGICNNLCKDFLSEKVKHQKAMEGYVPLADARRMEEVYGPHWLPRYERLMQVKDQLNDKQRKLLELYERGWGHEDMADALDYKNADTSKSTLQRIFGFIREVMQFVLFYHLLIS